MGNLTLSTITIPSYTVLDLYGARIFQANTTNLNMFKNSDFTGGNTQIEIFGGILDGNKAGQTEDSIPYDTRSIFTFKKVTHGSIHDIFSQNSNSCDVYAKDCFNFSVNNNTLINAGKSGIFFDGSAAGAGQFLYARDNYIAGQDENPVASMGCSDLWIEGNCCNGNTITSGINCNGVRTHINRNYIKSMQTLGISLNSEGSYSTDDSEICDNWVENCS